MSVAIVNASPSGFALTTSAYGSVGWSPSAPNISSSIPVGAGTAWAWWKFTIGGLVPGETLTSVTISGGNDFTVGGGGGGITRQAAMFVASGGSPNVFNGAGGAQMGTIVGTGAGQSLTYTFSPAGVTSDDLLAGNFYIGIAVSTNSADSGSGPGVFRYGAMSFKFTTGADQPTPPPGRPNGILTNPVANTSPGKAIGGQFESVRFQLTDTLPQPSLYFNWGTTDAGIVFASTGVNYWSQPKGTGGDPANPYIGDSGPILIGQNVAPGLYSVYMNLAGHTGNYSYQAVGQLKVRQRVGGGFFVEF